MREVGEKKGLVRGVGDTEGSARGEGRDGGLKC